MSCIAYVCSRVLLKGSRYSDIDFDRKAYIAISDFETVLFIVNVKFLKFLTNFLMLLMA